jgi:hypothetical protein
MEPYEQETPATVGMTFGAVSSTPCRILIRRLPVDTNDEQLRLMLLFSEQLLDVEILPVDHSKDMGLRSAIVKFSSSTGARQAKDMLHGKSTRPNDPELIVEFIPESPTGSRRYAAENIPSTHTNGPALTSPTALSRSATRFGDSFQSPGGLFTAINDPPNPEFYHSIFSPQSPIGNHITNPTHSSGKSLIHDTAEDEETRELLQDTVPYAQNGATQQRRATAPHLPISRLAALTINTSTNGNTSITPYGHSSMTPLPAPSNGMSPTVLNGASHSMGQQVGSYRSNNFPAVNPADQNPPCNTLYVGNLPVDTSEEELKAMFQKQRGYKRLCFRTKQNGPMCFVEFEDVSHATRTLHELYGRLLHNSTKGGIRLSFSKNPLGVRSGQATGPLPTGPMASMNGLMPASGNGFAVTNRPPPGLATPPGLSRLDYNGNIQAAQNGVGTSGPNRHEFGGSAQQHPSGTNTPSGYSGVNGHVWNGSQYNGHRPAGGSSPPNGPNPGYPGPGPFPPGDRSGRPRE